MIGVSTSTAFLMTAFSLAELGDGFGMFFDMYLLGQGWTETAVILSGILRGIVDLSLKGIVGDTINKTQYDRQIFLGVASLAVAASSCMVFFVDGAEDLDKLVMYIVRSIESVALAFLGPAFAAITLSAFGPEVFDQMQVQKELVSHVGSIVSAIVSGIMAWFLYPNIEVVFLLPMIFAISAIFFVRHIPRGRILHVVIPDRRFHFLVSFLSNFTSHSQVTH
jgi:MFS family permease